MRTGKGRPEGIEGLWGIAFGNGLRDQPTDVLFFAAGIEDEEHGLYGRIESTEDEGRTADRRPAGDASPPPGAFRCEISGE